MKHHELFNVGQLQPGDVLAVSAPSSRTRREWRSRGLRAIVAHEDGVAFIPYGRAVAVRWRCGGSLSLSLSLSLALRVGPALGGSP